MWAVGTETGSQSVGEIVGSPWLCQDDGAGAAGIAISGAFLWREAQLSSQPSFFVLRCTLEATFKRLPRSVSRVKVERDVYPSKTGSWCPLLCCYDQLLPGLDRDLLRKHNGCLICGAPKLMNQCARAKLCG